RMGRSGFLRDHDATGVFRGGFQPSVSLGFRVLVPGLTQRQWHQRDRGLVLLVSFLAALGTGLFCWGEPLGWVLLVFAFLTHAVATLDVLQQRSFPVFPRKIATSAMIVVMLLVVYLPLATLLGLFALPTTSKGESQAGYLVNCLAYKKQD